MTPAEFAAIPTPETDVLLQIGERGTILFDRRELVYKAKSLERRLHVAREALAIIAGKKQCQDHLITGHGQRLSSNQDVANEALRLIEEMK